MAQIVVIAAGSDQMRPHIIRPTTPPPQKAGLATSPRIRGREPQAKASTRDPGRMPRHPRPLPPHLGDAFGRARALAAGVSPGRLRTRDLERPFHGARLAHPDAAKDSGEGIELPRTPDEEKRARLQHRARAYAEVMGAHAFFIGLTAAALWGAPLPDDFDPEADLEVGTVYPHRAPRGRGVRARQVRPHLVTTRVRDGLRVASPASTWALLGGELDGRWLVILGDYFVRIPRGPGGRPRPRDQLTTPERLRAAASEPQRRHRRILQAALADVRVGSFSRLETEYRLDAAAAGLPEMELDVEIRDAKGHLLGIADGVHRRYRVLVEIEGDHHRTSRRQWNRDIERLAAFAAENWEVIRVTGGRVRGGTAATLVAAALRRHGWES